MTAVEEWRPVPGWPMYEVSSLGRVASLPRSNRPSVHVLTQHLNRRKGYLRVTLRDTTERWRSVYVHTLVLEAFIGPRPPEMEACHGDGDKHNNVLSNLRWDTKSANSLDAVSHGAHNQACKTHCPAGHEYDETNTYARWVDVGKGYRRRSCRQCDAARARKRYWAAKAAS